MDQRCSLDMCQAIGKSLRHCIGMRPIFQPQPIVHVGLELRREEPRLRREVARTLAQECEGCVVLFLERNDGLDAE